MTVHATIHASWGNNFTLCGICKSSVTLAEPVRDVVVGDRTTKAQAEQDGVDCGTCLQLLPSM